MGEQAAIAGLLAISSIAAALLITARRRRERRDTEALADAVAANLHVPQTLHPVIDPDRCIGSLSCISACAEGDILGLVDGKATLINASACIGHGKCELECPVDAIQLVVGSAQRGQDLPEVDEFFESSRPGVYVAGELGGMGLIRNAVAQGLQVAGFLSERLGKRRSAGDGVDVVVVGGGPAGLATALGLKQAGLSFQVLDQESLGGTIAHYPRQKVVMTEPLDLPFYGRLRKRLISKEELLAAWQAALAKAGISVREGVQVTGLSGADGDFTVETNRGPVRSRKVVLATGRRGTPRKLGVPGEELSKVSYRLVDPTQYDGKKVLVVGGGDSALEAAIMLAEQSGAEVTLSCRTPAFGRSREANRRKLGELVRQERVRALMSSRVAEVRERAVHLVLEGGERELPNDFVVVCAGGELPTEFLGKLQVGLSRHYGTAPGQRGDASHRVERDRRRLALGLFALGALTVAVLAAVGGDYYLLPRLERLRAPAHELLKPSGPWGHGVGIAATALMLSNFLYPLRKHWRGLKRAGPIRRWLTFHQFVGFMSPLVIAFHAAFQSNSTVATLTSAALLVVVLTGVVGRFVYGMVPTSDGRAIELAEVQARWTRMKAGVERLLDGVVDASPVRAFLARATTPPPGGSLVAMLVGRPFEARRSRRELRQLAGRFPSRAHFREFREAFWKLERLRTQVGFYRSLKRLLSAWRVLHAVLAIVLVVMIAAHIGVSLFLGYKWIFS